MQRWAFLRVGRWLRISSRARACLGQVLRASVEREQARSNRVILARSDAALIEPQRMEFVTVAKVWRGGLWLLPLPEVPPDEQGTWIRERWRIAPGCWPEGALKAPMQSGSCAGVCGVAGRTPVVGVLKQVLPQLVGWRLLAVRSKAPSLGLALQKQGVSKPQCGVREY